MSMMHLSGAVFFVTCETEELSFACRLSRIQSMSFVFFFLNSFVNRRETDWSSREERKSLFAILNPVQPDPPH